jgi:anaerobic C4-dicarboxylate transporter
MTGKSHSPISTTVKSVPLCNWGMYITAVNGYFFIPTYGSLIAAINFDLSGTTKIGRYVLNHSFMIPGLVATTVSVAAGLAIANLIV